MVLLSPFIRHRWRSHHHAAVVLCAGSVVLLAWWWTGLPSHDQRTLAATTAAPTIEPVGLTANAPQATDAADLSAAEIPMISTAVAVKSDPDPTPRGPANDEELRQQLLGSWADDFYGKRTFHFQADGTATMVLELDSVGQLLYGPQLTFFILWQLKDNVLSLKMTGGEPAGTAVSLAKLFGESSEQRVEHIGEAEMRLRSLDSNKLYVHRRVAESDSSKAP